ncbi:MAG: hypothetical protein K6G89_06540 [Clostridia bacterium]|nr:hypothetical protein [Clostridia bacterium]
MKNDKGNKIISIAAICFFALVISLIWIFGLAGMDAEPDPDSGEIRILAEFPTEFTNDYFSKINTYANDHSPMRNSIISLMNNMDRGAKQFYDEHINAPLYELISKANATPEPTATPYVTLAPDETPSPTPEPSPTPDFSGLFGEDTDEPYEDTTEPPETEAPTSKPEETPTDASSSPTATSKPTARPTAVPTPEPTPDPEQRKEYVAGTLDSIIIGDVKNFGLGDGSASAKLDEYGRTVDNSSQRYDHIVLRGWTGFTEIIESYGYKIGAEDPVFSVDFFTPEEDAVRAAGGEYARRFNITVPVEGIVGETRILAVVKLASGKIAYLESAYGPGCDTSFTYLGMPEPEIPAVISADSVSVEKGKDVSLEVPFDSNNYMTVILEGPAADAIVSQKSSESGVVIHLSESAVRFDAKAFDALAKALRSGQDITLSVREVSTDDLDGGERFAISEKIVAMIVSVEAYAGDTQVHSLGGGKAEITIRYSKPSDVDSANVKVAYVATDGTFETVRSSYSDGTVTFYTDHLSHFVVYFGDGEQDPEETEAPTATPDPGTSTCDHDFGDITVKTEPTCSRKGEGEQVCRLCGEVKKVQIPALGHEYVLVREQEASYAHDGYVLERCSRCGNGKVSNIVLRTSLPGFYNGRLPISLEKAGFKGIHDWYFYSGDNSIGYFQGDNILSEDQCREWTKTYEALQRECEKKGITVAFLIPPNKEQVYGEYMPSGVKVIEDSQKREPLYLEYLKKSGSTIHYVYPLSQLKSAKILYETYYQQDTHWNNVGGFVGVMQVYSSIGLPTTGLQNVDVIPGDMAGGDLVNLGAGPATHYTSYSVNYKPEVNCRQTFMYSNNVTGGNETPTTELKILESDAKTTRKAVIVGDSFRHAVAGYIAKDYCKVTVAHRGDFDTVSNYVQTEDGTVSPCGETVLKNALSELRYGDLLLVMAVERYDSSNVEIAGRIADYLANLPKS